MFSQKKPRLINLQTASKPKAIPIRKIPTPASLTIHKEIFNLI